MEQQSNGNDLVGEFTVEFMSIPWSSTWNGTRTASLVHASILRLFSLLVMEVELEEEALLSWKHFVAGALAGTAEHCGMYPVDTIKVCSKPWISRSLL